jgi:PRTRC genetic system ThiF family protein
MSSIRKTKKRVSEYWNAQLRSLDSLIHKIEKHAARRDRIPEKILATAQALHLALFGPGTGDIYWEQTVLPHLQYVAGTMVKSGPDSVPPDVRLLIKRACRLLEKPSLALADLKPARLRLPAFKELRLIQVGAGGTGSWLAPQVARLARMVQDEHGARVRVYFVDDDTVQAKNLRRQNFCEPELGQNKAEALARRYSSAYGIEAIAVTERFNADRFSRDSYYSDRLTLIIGCVDTPESRAAISHAIPAYRYASGPSNIFWLDAGNDHAAGQVYLGSAASPEGLSGAFPLPGLCLALPSPALQDPGLLMPQPEDEAEDEGLSCADLTARDSQSRSINQAVAAIAASYLFSMFDGVLDHFATYLNLRTGAMTSTPIMPENVAVASGAPLALIAPSLSDVLDGE